MSSMDIQDYYLFDGRILREKIKSLSRPELDEQVNQFSGQYALLCQRLEAFYFPNRTETFIRLRPGGLDDIDQAIAQAGTDPKELSLLKSFKELNRILIPFMDRYEEQVLAEVQYMSKEELRALDANVSETNLPPRSASRNHRPATTVKHKMPQEPFA